MPTNNPIQEIRETALPIKAQFMVIYQIAQVYSEVSFVYILDGLSLVNMLGLSHDSTSSEDMALKQHKLDRYKKLATEVVRSLTQKVVFSKPRFSNGGGD